MTNQEQEQQGVSKDLIQLFKDAQPTQEGINKVVVQTTNAQDISIIPSIKESERFIKYLNNKFSLGLPSNLIVSIQETSPRKKGFFMPKENIKAYQNDKDKLNFICLSSLFLKETPYETIAHEVAHAYNNNIGVKDCSSSQYHNKKFKTIAEKLLLKVDKSAKGYAYTQETEMFKSMLQEFKPDNTAFLIYQGYEEKEKKGSRNLLFMCSCGVKIRTAKNEEKPLNAVCGYCQSEFIEVSK